MKANPNIEYPYLKSLAFCLKKITTDGYSDHFKSAVGGIESVERGKVYGRDEIKMVNFFRFEGNGGPNAILYVIETEDGAKGTLVDSYGNGANSVSAQFFRIIDDLRKNIN